MNYFEHNDEKGRTLRALVLRERAERIKMLAVLESPRYQFLHDVTLTLTSAESETARLVALKEAICPR